MEDQPEYLEGRADQIWWSTIGQPSTVIKLVIRRGSEKNNRFEHRKRSIRSSFRVDVTISEGRFDNPRKSIEWFKMVNWTITENWPDHPGVSIWIFQKRKFDYRRVSTRIFKMVKMTISDSQIFLFHYLKKLFKNKYNYSRSSYLVGPTL